MHLIPHICQIEDEKGGLLPPGLSWFVVDKLQEERVVGVECTV